MFAKKMIGGWAGCGCAVAAFLVLAGCEVERNPLNTYTLTGQNLGVTAYREIGIYEGEVSFAGENPVKRREAQSLSDRYSERITFKNNAIMRYSKVFNGAFSAAWSDADNIKADIDNSTFYKDRAIVFDSSKVKTADYYTYLLQSSATDNCFVFRGTFGDRTVGRAGSRGNEEATGSLCFKAADKRLDALEREMTEILGRARFDRGALNKVNAEAHPGGIVEAAKDVGEFIPCYNPRLDIAYRAHLCGNSDKTIDDAEARKVAARLQAQRAAKASSANTSSGSISFAAAPPGTTIYTSGGGWFRVVGVDDMVMTTVNAAHATAHRFAMFMTPNVGSEFDVRAAEELWPLAVGKEVSLVRTLAANSWREVIKVVRTETVTVPAGTYETYVVEYRTQGMGGNYYDGTQTFWYAPAVGFMVKYDITVKSGTPTAGDRPWEVSRIVPPGTT